MSDLTQTKKDFLEDLQKLCDDYNVTIFPAGYRFLSVYGEDSFDMVIYLDTDHRYVNAREKI